MVDKSIDNTKFNHSTPKSSEQENELSQFEFESFWSFSFVHFISATFIICGIVTSMLLAKAYFDRNGSIVKISSSLSKDNPDTSTVKTDIQNRATIISQTFTSESTDGVFDNGHLSQSNRLSPPKSPDGTVTEPSRSTEIPTQTTASGQYLPSNSPDGTVTEPSRSTEIPTQTTASSQHSTPKLLDDTVTKPPRSTEIPIVTTGRVHMVTSGTTQLDTIDKIQQSEVFTTEGSILNEKEVENLPRMSANDATEENQITEPNTENDALLHSLNGKNDNEHVTFPSPSVHHSGHTTEMGFVDSDHKEVDSDMESNDLNRFQRENLKQSDFSTESQLFRVNEQSGSMFEHDSFENIYDDSEYATENSITDETVAEINPFFHQEKDSNISSTSYDVKTERSDFTRIFKHHNNQTGENEMDNEAFSEIDNLQEEFDKISDLSNDVLAWIRSKYEQMGIEVLMSKMMKFTDQSSKKFNIAYTWLLQKRDSLPIDTPQTDLKGDRLKTKDPTLTVDIGNEAKALEYRKRVSMYVDQGNYQAAIENVKVLCSLYPNDIELQTELGVYYMYNGQLEQARSVFYKVLKLNPFHGLTLLNLGAIEVHGLSDQSNSSDAERISEMLISGLNNTDISLHEPRHYQHLYDSLVRSGRQPDAFQYLQKAVNYGVLTSSIQLCSSLIPGIESHFIWTPDQLPDSIITQFKKVDTALEANLNEIIRADSIMHPEDPHLKERGAIEVIELFVDGNRQESCAYRSSSDKHQETSSTSIATTGLVPLCDVIGELIADCAFCDAMLIKMPANSSYWSSSSSINVKLRTVWSIDYSDEVNVDKSGYCVRLVGDHSSINNRNASVVSGEHFHRFSYDPSFVHHLESPVQSQFTQVESNPQSAILNLIVESWHPSVTDQLKSELIG